MYHKQTNNYIITLFNTKIYSPIDILLLQFIGSVIAPNIHWCDINYRLWYDQSTHEFYKGDTFSRNITISKQSRVKQFCSLQNSASRIDNIRWSNIANQKISNVNIFRNTDTLDVQLQTRCIFVRIHKRRITIARKFYSTLLLFSMKIISWRYSRIR